jgi:hypothetical protein
VPQAWGALAEGVIEEDYCETFGCGDDDWFDRNNATAMARFLIDHNPGVFGPRAALRLYGEAGSLRRPDILSHKRSRKEYYEIKPDSRDGRRAGRAKLAEIADFMAAKRLPYVAGTEYEPAMIRIPRVTAGPVIGRPSGYDYLSVRLAEPGLVVYRVCDRSLLEAD